MRSGGFDDTHGAAQLSRRSPRGESGQDSQAKTGTFVHVSQAPKKFPVRVTDGRGKLKIKLSKDGTSLEYTLKVDDISNVVASHIHLAPVGVNGPIVLFLFGPAGPGRGPVHGELAKWHENGGGPHRTAARASVERSDRCDRGRHGVRQRAHERRDCAQRTPARATSPAARSAARCTATDLRT